MLDYGHASPTLRHFDPFGQFILFIISIPEGSFVILTQQYRSSRWPFASVRSSTLNQEILVVIVIT
jgi:hypothetical protein